MKLTKYFIPAAITALFAVSCQQSEVIDFEVNANDIEIGPEGGVKTITVQADENWVATTESPWITISPTNGRGSVECRIMIDSALNVTSREGAVRIKSIDSSDKKYDFVVRQDGFGYVLSLDETSVEIADYANYDDRKFDVVVTTNVDFEVKIPDNAQNWLKVKKSALELDRDRRPRKSVLHFEWVTNSRPEIRTAEIQFTPKEDVVYDYTENLTVTQGASQPIPENCAEGDSLAVLAISRNLGCWTEWDPTTPMKEWENVSVWEEDMDGYRPEYKGRVKSVRFYLFNTKEHLPYEVKYLTAAESLTFYSNVNSQMKELTLGEDILALTQLKRLTIGAYGLVDLPDNFAFPNLEFLSLESNNFAVFPPEINSERLPKLHSLHMNTNQRSYITDLSNTVKTDIGGFIETGSLPEHLLKWNALDTLRLSMNYFLGELPKCEDYPKYSEAELSDSLDLNIFRERLPEGLPKVLPNLRFLGINGNRFRGELPDWILYHPKMDQWGVFVLVFPQEGFDPEGNKAGFVNEPSSMKYYYEMYTKKENPIYSGEEE